VLYGSIRAVAGFVCCEIDVTIECLARGAGNAVQWYFAIGIVFVVEILNPGVNVAQMGVED